MQFDENDPDIQTYRTRSYVALLFSILFACIALYYSYQVTKRLDAGETESAVQASKRAKLWSTVAYFLGGFALLIQVFSHIQH